MKSVDELPLEEVVRLAEQMLKIRAVLEAGANHYKRETNGWCKTYNNTLDEKPMNENDEKWLKEHAESYRKYVTISNAKKEAFLEMIELIDSKKF